MNRTCLFVAALITLTFVIDNPVLAVNKVELNLKEDTLFLGDELVAELKIDGVDRGVIIDFPDIAGVSFRQIGSPSSSTQTLISSGRVTRFSGLIYRIGISASKKGVFNIPGVKINHNGKTLQTRHFQVQVKDPGKISTMRVKVSFSEKEIFINQSVVVYFDWYVQDDIEDYKIRFPLLDRKDRLNLSLIELAGVGQTTKLTVNEYTVPFKKSQEAIAGESFTVYKVGFQIHPTDIGRLSLDPSSVVAMIRVGTELKQDFFGRTVRAPKLRRVFASSEPAVLQVLPLPPAPDIFTGGVGDFQVTTSASSSKVKVGDPIELTIRIQGNGRLEKIEQPTLSDQSDFKDNFVIVDSLQPGNVQENSIEFKQTIRPKHENVAAIPSVLFSYFDPEKKAYQTTKSSPIPLKVLSARKVSKKDIVSNTKPAENMVASFTKQVRGIHANYMFEDALVTQSTPWTLMFLLICPPFVYFGTLIVTVRSKRFKNDAALVRSKAAIGVKNKHLKLAKTHLKSEGDEFYLALSKALRGFIGDKLNLGAGQLTTPDLKSLIDDGKITEQLASEISGHLDELDRLRFTAVDQTAIDREKLLKKVDDFLRCLNKKL